MSKTIINSINKALTILDILVFEDFENEGIALSELSKMTEIKPSTLHNILKTMVHCGYVQQYDNLKYAAGMKCKSIGFLNKFSPGLPLYNKIEVIISALSKKLSEAVVFAVLIDGNRIPVVTCNNDNVIKVDCRSLEQKSIYSLVTGRILTAFANQNNLELIKEKWGFPGEKWDNINTDLELSKALKNIQEKGFAENIEGNSLYSIAVPAVGEHGEIASIGCYAPLFRCDDQKRIKILNELKKTATDIKNYF